MIPYQGLVHSFEILRTLSSEIYLLDFVDEPLCLLLKWCSIFLCHLSTFTVNEACCLLSYTRCKCIIPQGNGLHLLHLEMTLNSCFTFFAWQKWVAKLNIQSKFSNRLEKLSFRYHFNTTKCDIQKSRQHQNYWNFSKYL